jgi:CHAT domain-containing protein/tetratricopeptide (TPR) repeat protein
LACAFLELGQYQTSITHFEESLEHATVDIIAQYDAYAGIGSAYNSMKQTDRAISAYQQAIQIAEQAKMDKGLWEYLLCNLGTCHVDLKEYTVAADYYNKYIDATSSLSGSAVAKIGLGMIYCLQGEHEKSVKLFREQLSIARGLNDEGLEEIASRNLAVALSHMGSVSEAVAELFHTLQLHDKVQRSLPQHDNMRISLFESHTPSYTLMVLALVKMKDWKLALCISERSKARSLTQELTADVIPWRGEDVEWAELQRMVVGQQHTALLEYYFIEPQAQLVVWVVTPEGHMCAHAEINTQNVDLKLMTLLRMVRASMGVKGRGLQIMDNEVGGEEGGQGVRQSKEVEELIALFVRVSCENGGKEVVNGEATSARESDVLDQIFKDPLKIAQCKAALEEHNEVRTWLESEREKAVPHGMQNTFEVLLTKTCLCWHDMYKLAHVDSAIYGSASERRYAAERAADLLDEVSMLRALHEMLVEPVAGALEEFEDVLIVPHGELFTVPWAALLDANGTFMIEKHALRLAPSLSTARQPSHPAPPQGTYARPKTQQPLKLCVVGNPYGTDPPLPHAESEASDLVSQLHNEYKQPPNVIVSAVGERGKAPQKKVLKWLGDSDWAHFACHACLDEQVLSLGKSKPDADASSSDKGLSQGSTKAETISMHDLEKLKVKMKSGSTVVLSACDTARGQLLGEGVVGLVRAFIKAGAWATVSTLWSVGDESTCSLMKGFYRGVWEGKCVHAALRDAMLGMMGRSAYERGIRGEEARAVTAHIQVTDGNDSSKCEGVQEDCETASRSWTNEQGKLERAGLELLFLGKVEHFKNEDGSPLTLGDGFLNGETLKRLFDVWTYKDVWGYQARAVAQSKRTCLEKIEDAKGAVQKFEKALAKRMEWKAADKG